MNEEHNKTKKEQPRVTGADLSRAITAIWHASGTITHGKMEALDKARDLAVRFHNQK